MVANGGHSHASLLLFLFPLSFFFWVQLAVVMLSRPATMSCRHTTACVSRTLNLYKVHWHADKDLTTTDADADTWQFFAGKYQLLRVAFHRIKLRT
jgi:hypothetical protein